MYVNLSFQLLRIVFCPFVFVFSCIDLFSPLNIHFTNLDYIKYLLLPSPLLFKPLKLTGLNFALSAFSVLIRVKLKTRKYVSFVNLKHKTIRKVLKLLPWKLSEIWRCQFLSNFQKLGEYKFKTLCKYSVNHQSLNLLFY